MNVKTYRTKSLQEALDNIKRDLGSEALVLSTREVVASRPFGFLRKPKWEVAAAARPDTTAASVATLPAPSPAPAPRPVAVAAAATAPAPIRMPPPAEPQDMDDTPVSRRPSVNDRRID